MGESVLRCFQLKICEILLYSFTNLLRAFYVIAQQWHASTTFPEPMKPGHTMLCIDVVGDWTKEMHEQIRAPCNRLVYIRGPFRSEFSDTVMDTRNAIAIASGIGITPTLSLMLSHAKNKRINIIWMCRDAGLIEHFLHKVDFSQVTRKSFVLIFYTGKRALVLPSIMPTNLFIFHSRPDLEKTISVIVTSIESKKGLPENICKSYLVLLPWI